MSAQPEKHEIFDWELPFKFGENEFETERWCVLEEFHMPLLFISESGNLLLLLEEGDDYEDEWLLIKCPIALAIQYLAGSKSLHDLIFNSATDVYRVLWNVNKDHLDVVEKISSDKRLEYLIAGLDLTSKIYRTNKTESLLKFFTQEV